MKKHLSLFLAIIFALLFATPAMAAETGTQKTFTDVQIGSYYYEAVYWALQEGITNGTSDTTFSPEDTCTRGQIVTFLWKAAGSPEPVTEESSFTDIDASAYYYKAVLWAVGEKITSGVSETSFAPGMTVDRGQAVTFLYKFAGEEMQNAHPFTDISEGDYFYHPVIWAYAKNITNGTGDTTFGPKDPCRRGQIVTLLYKTMLSLRELPPVPGPSKVMVAYFSATGSTEKIANHIGDVLGVTPYRITPLTPYTTEDLNYNDRETRATREQNDPTARPEFFVSITDMSPYDVIFVGYPIWWGQAPKIMYTFMESYSFEGKTIIPFCTSGSSGIGTSATNLSKSAEHATWLPGNRFSGSATRDQVEAWVKGLDLGITSD